MKHNMTGYIKNYFKKNHTYIIIFLFLILWMIPFFKTGIIINDELQARRLAMKGFMEFYKTEFMGWRHQGRFLAAFINSFTKYVGFIGARNGDYFKIYQIIILIMVSSLYGVLCQKLFNNKQFSVFSAMISLALLPISFEHTSPNAFVSLFGISFLLLLLALILYVDYIDDLNKRYKAIWAMVMFFCSCMSYEAFLTFVVLFFMIILGKKGLKSLINNIKLYLIPFFTAIFYLGCYVACAKVFPSQYDGNQIGIKSLTDPLKVLKDMFLACIPGFYVFSSKYKSIREIYNTMNPLDYTRITLVTLLFVLILVLLFVNNKVRVGEENNKITIIVLKKVYVIFCGISFMILPSLPNSIALMYQGNTGLNGFTALPITYFEYFAAIFVFSYIIWFSFANIKEKKYILPILALTVLFVNVQQMNSSFAHEQNNNYTRLTTIEKFLETNTMKSMGKGEYYSRDLYKQNNLLAIHNGYWAQYCNDNIGIQISIISEMSNQNKGFIYYDDDNFVVITDDNFSVLSTDRELTSKSIKVGEDKYVDFDFPNEKFDNGFYVYTCKNDGQYFSEKGYIVNYGVYPDNWLEKESSFFVKTSKNGKVYMTLYYPGTDYNGKCVNVLLNDEIIYEGIFSEQLLDINFDVESTDWTKISINCDFEFTDKGADERDLAVVLQEISVK